MTSPTKFFHNESEKFASYFICKFIPIIQFRASTCDLLHSAMFSALEQLAIAFYRFYPLSLNLTKNIVLINMKLSSTT